MAYPQLSSQTYKPTLTQQQMTALLEHPSLKGKNPSEVYAYLKTKGYDVQGFKDMQPGGSVTDAAKSKMDPEMEQQLKYMNPIVGQLRMAKDIGLGAAEKIANATGFLIGKPVEFAGEKLGGEGSFVDEFGENIQSAGSDIIGEPKTKAEANMRGIGGFTVEAGGATMLGGPITSKVTGLLGKGTIPKILGFGAAAPVETAVFTIGDEQRLPTKGEAAWSTVFAGGLPVLGKLAGFVTGVGKKGYELFKPYFGKSSDDAIKALEQSGMDKETVNVLTQLKNTGKQDELAGFYKKALESAKDSKILSPKKEVADVLYDGFTKANTELKSTGNEIGALVKGSTQKVADEASLVSAFDEELAKLNIKPGEGMLTADSFSGSSVQFSDSTKNKLMEVYNTVADKATSGQGVTYQDVWNLKRSVSDLVAFNPNLEKQVTAAGEIPLVGLMNKFDEILQNPDSGIKGLAELNQKYAALSEVVSYVNKKIGPDAVKGIGFADAIFNEKDIRAMEAAQILGGYAKKDVVEMAQLVKVAMAMAGDTSTNGWFGNVASTAMNPKSGIVDIANKMLTPNKEKLIERVLGILPPEAQGVEPGVLEKIILATLNTLNQKATQEVDIGKEEISPGELPPEEEIQ